MGRVFFKTKFDRAMNMDIPHSINIANAMYGFREMGAELIPYHSLDDIYDVIERTDIVLDYIDQCNEAFRKFGIETEMMDYPDVMHDFLGRKMWRDTINNISSDEEKWRAGYFVKPVHSKAFTGKVIDSLESLIGCGNYSENYEVIVSEPLEIEAEWRCFLYYDKIIDVRPYGVLKDGSSYLYHYDAGVLMKMLQAFLIWKDRPMACSMDICVTKDGRTLLVEMNDAYALGCYGLPSIYYAKFISARWSQLLGVDDAFCF